MDTRILTSRIQSINIDTQIHRILGTNAVPDPLDNTISADLVNLARLDDFEATVAVVLIIGGTGKGRADAGVDVGVVFQKTFLRGMEEIGAVVDAGLFTGRAAKHFGLPGVQVGVEVDDGDGAVFTAGSGSVVVLLWVQAEIRTG